MEGPRQVGGGVVAISERRGGKTGAFGDLQLTEFVVLLPLLLLIFYIGLQPYALTSVMEPSVLNILQNVGSAFIH
jgi:NADH-quinone oxidoreductase subunit M